jgi:hypothetical protein
LISLVFFHTVTQNVAQTCKALKERKRHCKEFGFTAGMLKASLVEGRKKNV